MINDLYGASFGVEIPIQLSQQGHFPNGTVLLWFLAPTRHDQAVVPVVKGLLPTDDTHDWELKGVVNDDTIDGN